MNLNPVYVLIVFLGIFLNACDWGGEETISQDEIIRLDLIPEVDLRADGRVITLRATIAQNAKQEFRSITFEKSNGLFLGVDGDISTVVANTEGIAEIAWQLPLSVQTTFLRARTGEANSENYEAPKAVELDFSYPDSLILEPQTRLVSASAPSSSLILNTLLVKQSFRPSAGIGLNYRAQQADSSGTLHSIGQFLNPSSALSNEEAEVQVTYEVLEEEYFSLFPIELIVSSRNDAGEEITSSVSIQVIE